MVPRKGAYVATFSMKDVVEVFESRGALQGLAADLAAERITDEEREESQRQLVESSELIEQADLNGMVEVDTGFHQILYQASRNQRLAQIINNLRDQIQRFRQTCLSYPGRMKSALEEHREIVDAISARDPELARRLAQEHIENAENSMMQVIRQEKPNAPQEEPQG